MSSTYPPPSRGSRPAIQNHQGAVRDTWHAEAPSAKVGVRILIGGPAEQASVREYAFRQAGEALVVRARLGLR